MAVDDELLNDRLPTYLTRFIGREAEMVDLVAQLQTSRMLTVTGMGGVGKTRLAIEVAKRWRSSKLGPSADIYWVPLAAVTDPSRVAAAIAVALGLDRLSGAAPITGLVHALTDEESLLVLDNCEQVGASCREVVTALLAGCPSLRVLATSRTSLMVPKEHVFAVPALGAGSSGGVPGRADATDLFVDRAESVAAGYILTTANAQVIGEICARLGAARPAWPDRAKPGRAVDQRTLRRPSSPKHDRCTGQLLATAIGKRQVRDHGAWNLCRRVHSRSGALGGRSEPHSPGDVSRASADPASARPSWRDTLPGS